VALFNSRWYICTTKECWDGGWTWHGLHLFYHESSYTCRAFFPRSGRGFIYRKNIKGEFNACQCQIRGKTVWFIKNCRECHSVSGYSYNREKIPADLLKLAGDHGQRTRVDATLTILRQIRTIMEVALLKHTTAKQLQ